jgi:hypothetical protein
MRQKIRHLRLEVVAAKGYTTTTIVLLEALASVEEALKDLSLRFNQPPHGQKVEAKHTRKKNRRDILLIPTKPLLRLVIFRLSKTPWGKPKT